MQHPPHKEGLCLRQVRACGIDHSLIKQIVAEGNSFESARPPFEVGYGRARLSTLPQAPLSPRHTPLQVCIHASVRLVPSNGVLGSGRVLFSSRQGQCQSAGQEAAPLQLALGCGQLPPGKAWQGEVPHES